MLVRKSETVYSVPKLVVYGDVRDITQAINNASATADGGKGQDKTA